MSIVISSIRVRLENADQPEEPLRAFLSIIFNHVFLVRRCKLILGQSDGLLLFTPSYDNVTQCPRCGRDNPVRRHRCRFCPAMLPSAEQRCGCGPDERPAERTETCHPVDRGFREYLLECATKAYEAAQRAEIREAKVRFDIEGNVTDVEALTRNGDFDEFVFKKPRRSRQGNK